VQDTGPGIAPQDMEVIFEPFVQTENGEKARAGTGLGLAISRQFARIMGGTLTAFSSGATGQGALFTLELPVELTHPPDLGARSVPPSARPIPVSLAPGQLAPDGSAYRLLIAEDRAESRELLVKLLSQLGFEVREAANGLEAINLWEKWRPHLIWMDLRMPVMDGHEAVRKIKATPEGQATIIIALTASAFEEERTQVLAEGCDDYVRKPIQQDQIADKLTHHLGVQFIYQDTIKGRAESYPPHDTLDLTGLPAEWVANLKQAAIEADADIIMGLTDRIREQNPALALALAGAIESFDYESILGAVQATGGPS
jgi:CheY-like chemotaxis protein